MLIIDADAQQPGAGMVPAAHLPAFAGVDPAQLPPPAAGLMAAVAAASVVVLRGRAGANGAPGVLLNALQLLGGPAYGRRDRSDLFAGKQVRVEVTGDAYRCHRAVRQLARTARALGCDDVWPGTATGHEQAPATALADTVPTTAGHDVAGQRGQQLLDLSLGEVVLGEHPWLAQAIARAGRARSRYSPPVGATRLREAIRGRERFRAAPGRREVAVTYGASLGLVATLNALVEPGATVLVPDPAYPPYRAALRRLGLTPLGYRIPPPGQVVDLSQAATARAIIWNSPHNPTGWVATPADLEVLDSAARAYGLVIISDEVYADLIWEGEHLSPARNRLAEQTVVLDSCAKRFAAAGLRIGWTEVPEHWLDPIVRAHWDLAMGAPLTGQHAATALLRDEAAILAAVRDQLDATWRAGAPLLAPFGVERPAAGCYLWIPTPPGHSDESFVNRLRRAGVLALAGQRFGPAGVGRFRISLGVPTGEAMRGLSLVREVLARAESGGP